MNKGARLTHAYLEAHPADAARVLERLTVEETAGFLSTVPARLGAPVLHELTRPVGARCLMHLDETTAAAMLRRLPPNSGAALLRQVPVATAEGLLSHLPTLPAIWLRTLLGHAEESVGAWADPRVPALHWQLTAAQAWEALRHIDIPSMPELYIVDEAHRLQGRLDPIALLRAGPATELYRLAEPAPPTLSGAASMSTVRRHEGWIRHPVLPVTDSEGRLLGGLSHAALVRHGRANRGRLESENIVDGLRALASVYWIAMEGVFLAAMEWLNQTPPRQVRK